MSPAQVGRQALAEFIGSAFLLIAVVGSGIAAERLSPDDVGLQLLENAAATGAALVAVILVAAQLGGTVLAIGAIWLLYPRMHEQADEVVVPHAGL